VPSISNADCQLSGSLARIGPNLLVTNDYEVVRRMNGVRSRYNKDIWYAGVRFDPPNDHLVSMTNEKKHLELRAKMSAGVSR
jgi:hypothetical protein